MSMDILKAMGHTFKVIIEVARTVQHPIISVQKGIQTRILESKDIKHHRHHQVAAMGVVIQTPMKVLS